MRTRSRSRNVGRRLLAVGPATAPALTGNDILTIENGVGPDEGSIYVTTAAPHGLVGDETVVISGSSVAGYNTTHTVLQAGETIFMTDGTYTEDATGGTWEFAE